MVFDADDRRLQAALGRLRQSSRPRPIAGAYDPARAAGEAVPQRELRQDLAGRHGLRLRSPQQPHPGVPQERQVRQGSVVVEDDDRRRLGVGCRVLERSAAAFLFVADGQDQKVFVLDRDTLAVVSSFGDGGRWPGAFYGVGSVAVDSKGNVYTGENYEGKRVQKFVKR